MSAYRRHLSQRPGACQDTESPVLIERPSTKCERLDNLQRLTNVNHPLDLRTLIGEHVNNIPNNLPIPQPTNQLEAPEDSPIIPPLEPPFYPPSHTSTTPISSTYQPDIWLSTSDMVSSTHLHGDVVDNAPLPTESDWFNRSLYERVVDGEVIRYVHRTAGCILGKSSTAWEDLLAKREKEHPNAPWHPFPNEKQWMLGHWLATCKSSQAKIDEFLDMEGVSNSCFMSGIVVLQYLA